MKKNGYIAILILIVLVASLILIKTPIMKEEIPIDKEHHTIYLHNSSYYHTDNATFNATDNLPVYHLTRTNEYMEFNNSKFYIDALTNSNITLQFLDDSITYADQYECAMIFYVNCTSTVYFNITGFAEYVLYEIRKDDAVLERVRATSGGYVNFSDIPNNSTYSIYLLDTILTVDFTYTVDGYKIRCYGSYTGVLNETKWTIEGDNGVLGLIDWGIYIRGHDIGYASYQTKGVYLIVLYGRNVFGETAQASRSVEVFKTPPPGEEPEYPDPLDTVPDDIDRDLPGAREEPDYLKFAKDRTDYILIIGMVGIIFAFLLISRKRKYGYILPGKLEKDEKYKIKIRKKVKEDE